MPGRKTTIDLHFVSKLFGPLHAAFDYYHDSGAQHLHVVDDDGFVWMEVDLTENIDLDVEVLFSRLYEALNGGNDDHAAHILRDFVDSGDPWHGIRRGL